MKIRIITLAFLILSGCNYSVQKGISVPENLKKWALLDFVKADSINPILNPSSDQIFFCPLNKKEIRWEERNVLNPSAVVKDGKVYLIYRAQDNEMTSRLGLAISDDGLHFKKQPSPVFYPDSDNMHRMNGKGEWRIPGLWREKTGHTF